MGLSEITEQENELSEGTSVEGSEDSKNREEESKGNSEEKEDKDEGGIEEIEEIGAGSNCLVLTPLLNENWQPIFICNFAV